MVLSLLFVATAIGVAANSGRHLPPKMPPTAPFNQARPALAEPATQLACATVGFRDELRKFGENLAKLPALVDDEKWTTVSGAAMEVREKADTLLVACGKMEQNLESLKLEDEKLQERLDEMVKEFENLATQAQDDAEQMPERLAIIAEREHTTWIEGAKMVRAFKEHYTKLLDYYSRETGTMANVRPMLERMKTEAQLYAELAEVGQKLDDATSTLNSFSKQLNEILNMFDGMSRITQRVINDYSDPTATRLFENAAASIKEA